MAVGSAVDLGQLVLDANEAYPEPFDSAEPAFAFRLGDTASRLSWISSGNAHWAESDQGIGQRTQGFLCPTVEVVSAHYQRGFVDTMGIMAREARSGRIWFAGHRISYRAVGHGPALVLVKPHRHPRDYLQIRLLSDRYRIIQVEPLGFGASDRPHDYPRAGVHCQGRVKTDPQTTAES